MKSALVVVATTLAAIAGFAGGRAVAAESPPLVAVCVNAVDGWEIETMVVGCVNAAKIVRGLVTRAPKGHTRVSNMSCTVGYAGRIATSIRCAGSRSRFVRADLRPKGAKATPVPPVLRCRDYVDRLGRRWAVRSVRFGCLDARAVLAELAAERLTAKEQRYVERAWNVGCWVPGGLPREISCWWIRSEGYFNAQVRLAPTPSPTISTTETQEP